MKIILFQKIQKNSNMPFRFFLELTIWKAILSNFQKIFQFLLFSCVAFSVGHNFSLLGFQLLWQRDISETSLAQHYKWKRGNDGNRFLCSNTAAVIYTDLNSPDPKLRKKSIWPPQPWKFYFGSILSKFTSASDFSISRNFSRNVKNRWNCPHLFVLK